MYEFNVKGKKFTLPKENLIMFARFESKFAIKIETDQDAIDYFESIGIEVSEVKDGLQANE